MRHSAFTAVYDACVLYPAPLRDLLIHLAMSGRFRARWSMQIMEEWQRNLQANRPDISAEKLERTAMLMNEAIADVCVTGYENLIDGLHLPDRNDRHVLAAAIRCGASVIVTFNLADFPAEALREYGIEAQHPDEFIEDLFDLDAVAVMTAARNQRRQLTQPPVDVDRYLEILARQGLAASVRRIGACRSLL